MTTASQLTVGGLAVALALVALAAFTFWRSGKDPKSLIPSGEGLAAGVLASLSSGGILGHLAGGIAAAANTGGDWVMGGATGASGGTIAPAQPDVQLSPGGALLTVVAAGVLIFMIKAAGKEKRRRIIGGVIVGSLLGLTAGATALFGATLVPAVNGLGDGVLGWFGYQGPA